MWEGPAGECAAESPRILPNLRAAGFSQDSGLYIEGLPKERQPGVHVRRVNGVNLTDEQMRKYYKKIAAELGGRCVAQYQNAICLVFLRMKFTKPEAVH